VRQAASKHDIVGGLQVDSVPAAGVHDTNALIPVSPPDKTPALPPTSSQGYLRVSVHLQ